MGSQVVHGLATQCGAEWLAPARDEFVARDAEPTLLLGSKLISAAVIARVLDSPCALCRRAEAARQPRPACHALGCDRWSTRRARRWMRRSQCSQRPGEPECPARHGASCECQVGFRLAVGGPWCTTLGRLRTKFPDLADLILMAQSDDD
jgi:hypothetical protein